MMNHSTFQHRTQDLIDRSNLFSHKDTSKSVVDLEHLEEVFKATNDQLDWHNPEGKPYPHDLSKPLPLIRNARDDMDRNHLMHTNELHKFSDGTLNYVRTSLSDIATRIQMEYFPKKKWTKQDKQRARVMIKAIEKKPKDRRLMRSLEKFVGGRPYRGILRLNQGP
ncbi:hypothetical protein Tco_0370530 [Tanacetum coccineum]